MAGQLAAPIKPTRPIPPALNTPEGQALIAEREAAEAAKAKELPAWRRRTGKLVPWLLVLFLTGLVLQVFLAGYGLSEVGGQGMDLHVMFSHVIELIPLLIILVGFLGGDKGAGIGGITLFVMFFLQYLFIGTCADPGCDPQVSESLAAVMRALHPTNGVLMVALTFALLLPRLKQSTASPAPNA